MEKYCENCGAKIRDGAKFCSECGTKAEDTLPKLTNDLDYCPNCGEKVEHNEGFCQSCGTNLVSQEPTQYESFFKKNKNTLIILATVVVVCLIIACAISITSNMPVDVGTQRVSIGSHDFEIPGDYKIVPSTIDVDYTGYSAVFSQGYANDKEDINIGVMTIPYNVDGNELAASQGGVQKNMMGVNGYYTENNGVYTFAFADGMYLMVVSATSPYVLDEITYLGW